MAKCFYNRTRGPLPITLPNGSSAVIAPKSKLPVPKDGMTPSLSALLRKGDLVMVGYDDDEAEKETEEKTEESVPASPPTVTEPATAPTPE